jgi:hypothetical protein
MTHAPPRNPLEIERSARRSHDVPARGLDQALRIPQALADNYAKNPTKPLRVAEAVGMQPLSSAFRMLCGASIAYGLTEGGYNSEAIALTPLGPRIVAPTKRATTSRRSARRCYGRASSANS